jgi:hypothetical protein
MLDMHIDDFHVTRILARLFPPSIPCLTGCDREAVEAHERDISICRLQMFPKQQITVGARRRKVKHYPKLCIIYPERLETDIQRIRARISWRLLANWLDLRGLGYVVQYAFRPSSRVGCMDLLITPTRFAIFRGFLFAPQSLRRAGDDGEGRKS